MQSHIFSIGIIFNGLVCGFVGATAVALVLFLRRRWERLPETMRAYTWFWWFTALVWMLISIRYMFVGNGYVGPEIRYFDSLVQVCIFFTGPTLLYYAVLRVIGRKEIAQIAAILSFIIVMIGIIFILQPNGVPTREVTLFSAESTVNAASFAIFTFQATIILFLLLSDIAITMRAWRKNHSSAELHNALYSAAVVLYLVLGSIDESKIITDWPLVVFRLFYTGAFLFVYLTIIQSDISHENYLVQYNTETML